MTLNPVVIGDSLCPHVAIAAVRWGLEATGTLEWYLNMATELGEGIYSQKASAFPSVNSNDAASYLTGSLGG